MNEQGDWWCPTCEFTIWGSKSKCSRCGHAKPAKSMENMEDVLEISPSTDTHGPYSTSKGGYYGDPIPGEPLGLTYPNCGCTHLEWCPKRHHKVGCQCYTCRYKTGKW